MPSSPIPRVRFEKAVEDLRSSQAELAAAERSVGNKDGTVKGNPGAWGLASARNQCSLNTSVQIVRHPTALSGVRGRGEEATGQSNRAAAPQRASQGGDSSDPGIGLCLLGPCSRPWNKEIVAPDFIVYPSKRLAYVFSLRHWGGALLALYENRGTGRCSLCRIMMLQQ